MSTLESIEKAVSSLSAQDRSQFRRWYSEFDGDEWDRQIENDARLGKLDALATEALAEYHAGKAIEI